MGIFPPRRPPEPLWSKREATLKLASLIIAIVIVILTAVVILSGK
jgi:hypothetical protein